jgi:hypothetical protein
MNKIEKFFYQLRKKQCSRWITIEPPKQVTRIKIFKANWIEEIETSINDWLRNNPQLEIEKINTHTAIMWDFFASSQPPQICNQWSEYIWTIIYKDYENSDTK